MMNIWARIYDVSKQLESIPKDRPTAYVRQKRAYLKGIFDTLEILHYDITYDTIAIKPGKDVYYDNIRINDVQVYISEWRMNNPYLKERIVKCT